MKEIIFSKYALIAQQGHDLTTGDQDPPFRQHGIFRHSIGVSYSGPYKNKIPGTHILFLLAVIHKCMTGIYKLQ